MRADIFLDSTHLQTLLKFKYYKFSLSLKGGSGFSRVFIECDMYLTENGLKRTFREQSLEKLAEEMNTEFINTIPYHNNPRHY